jgi:hypothetical protein
MSQQGIHLKVTSRAHGGSCRVWEGKLFLLPPFPLKEGLQGNLRGNLDEGRKGNLRGS